MEVVSSKIRKGYKQTEVGVIPEDWELKKLEDVGEIKMCRRVFNHETVTTGIIPFFKIGTFGKEPDAYITEALYNSYRRKFSFPKPGDVLISAAGTIGRTVVYDGKPSYFQDSNIVWIDNDESLVYNTFLYYFYKVAKYNTEGGTIQRLYNSIIKNTDLVCPIKEEQKAIASALSDIDSYIESLSEVIEKKKNIKTATMQQLLSGKKRLPGFSGEWERIPLNMLLHYIQPTKYLVSSTDYSDSYSTPVLTVGKTFILGYTNEVEGIFMDFPCIIFDDFTTESRYVDFPFKAKSSAMKMLLPISETLNLYYIYLSMQQLNFKIGDHKRHWISEYSLLKIPLPGIKEQNEITIVLKEMQDEITNIESQLSKLTYLKQGAMHELLTGNIRLV